MRVGRVGERGGDNQFDWQRAPKSLDDRLPWTLRKPRTLSHWELVLSERSYFLGPNPPSSLPNDNHLVPCAVDQDPQNTEKIDESSLPASHTSSPERIVLTSDSDSPMIRLGEDSFSPTPINDQ